MIDRRMIDRKIINRRMIDRRMTDRKINRRIIYRKINRIIIDRRIMDRKKINIYLEFSQRSLPLTALTAVGTDHGQSLNLSPRGFIKIYLYIGNKRNIALE